MKLQIQSLTLTGRTGKKDFSIYNVEPTADINIKRPEPIQEEDAIMNYNKN